MQGGKSMVYLESEMLKSRSESKLIQHKETGWRSAKELSQLFMQESWLLIQEQVVD